MPPWGRPSGAQDAGRYVEGAEDDIYRFQELSSDDEKNGVLPHHGHVSNGKHLHNPDDLYFNDMDIRAWERRASALEGSPYDLGHDMQEEDEGYYDDAGEAVSRAEYEELLFTRVLDKIRIARAVGNSDVQLSQEELDAYHTRLYGATSPAVRSQPKSPLAQSPLMDDAASMLSVNATRPGHSSSSKSKSRKSEPRTSLFSSKPKKERRPERQRAASNVSSGSSQIAPGFVIPGPDGHRMYTPINAYQGNLARDPDTRSQPGPRSVSGSSQTYGGYAHSIAASEIARDVPGSFLGRCTVSPPSHHSASPPWQGRPPSTQQPTQEPLGSRVRSPSIQSANLVPFPVEPYQYHSFSPSSSSQPSPQLQYTRRPSVTASEATYTSMPRRVPIPSQAAAPLASPFDTSPTQPYHPGAGLSESVGHQGSAAVEVIPEPVSVQPAKASGSGRDGERRRKSGKSRKKT